MIASLIRSVRLFSFCSKKSRPFGKGCSHGWRVSLQIFHPKEFPITTDRERLVALLNALDASETTFRRDPPIRGKEDTGDWAIWGRDDDDDSGIPIGMSCRVYRDGDGWLMYFTVADADKGDRQPSSLPWKNAKAKLSFCNVTQDGDWEGCLRLDHLPSPAEAKAIRDVLGIRKRRHLSAEEKNRASTNLSVARNVAKSAKRPPPVRQAA
jgi:hypothetical protein